ncbi:Kinesin motor domain [Trypanosoma melophagium]|uniref:Kinesin motor domain n=1 Tax=Trypanosoma melophagium TaxID=715481 RepID=UPI00351A0065|nr:Kinesin motor domain [Trypanosoma melophagium]
MERGTPLWRSEVDVNHLLSINNNNNNNNNDKPIVPLLTDGYHVAVVAYGSPQSGKTYTLFSESGIVTHVVRGLCQQQQWQ